MNKSKFSLDTDKDVDVCEIDRKALKNFAKGAVTHELVDISTNIDWQKEDPNELPSYNFRLRLNKYQIGLLKHVARLENRSVSNMIKVTLLTELGKKVT